MKRRLSLAALPIACLVLAGCHFGGDKAPTGQVVATVNGEEITQLELQAELAGVKLPNDPAARKSVEQRALQMIIARKAFAKAAKEQGVDKTPEFALQEQRSTDNLLAQSLEQKLATSVPTPNKDDASIYVSNHPDSFAQRKIFSVNQIRIAQPVAPDLAKAIQPLNSLPEIMALLDQRHVPYEKGAATIDSAVVEPKVLDSIIKLPAGAVFIVPNGNSVLINQISDTKVVPLTGDDANKLAVELLKRQHSQEAVQKGMGEIVGKAMKTVHYSAAYQPAKPIGAVPSSSAPPAAAAPAAPAAKAG